MAVSCCCADSTHADAEGEIAAVVAAAVDEVAVSDSAFELTAGSYDAEARSDGCQR